MFQKLVINLLKKIKTTKKEIYKNISPWQRVQLSRHPSRPYTLDYIKFLTNDTFLELHGDRNIKDDKAMIGGLGKIDNQTFMFIGPKKVITLRLDNIEILVWLILKVIEKLLD